MQKDKNLIKYEFYDKFEAFCTKFKLLKRNYKIIIGFSGGPDSTALLCVLKYFSSNYRLKLLAAHINYNLRGENSIQDEKFCRSLCDSLSIHLVVKNVQLENNTGMEAKAREIRMNFFNELLSMYKMNKVALGHNQKDQTETVLFRLARGTSLSGLKGILPVNGDIIHPLLPYSREEIYEFLEAEGIQWREDESNNENKYSRNKIRNEIVPWFEKNINAKFIEHVYNTTVLLDEADEIVFNSALNCLKQIQKKGSPFTLDISLLLKQKRIIRFSIYKHIFSEITGSAKDFYTTNFEELESIFNSEGSKRVQLPNNLVAIKKYNTIEFKLEEASAPEENESQKEINAKKNYTVFADYRIGFNKLKNQNEVNFKTKDTSEEYFDFDKISFPISIRYRLPGDSFIPLGMKHRKKLKDFFIDEKISKFERDKILIFVDANGRIFWIGGLRISQDFCVTSDTKWLYRIKIEKVPESKPRSAERKKLL